MDDDMLVEHGKDTTQMWVKYEDCVQEIALTKADAQATIEALQAQLTQEQALNTVRRDAWWQSVKELEAALDAEREKVKGLDVELERCKGWYKNCLEAEQQLSQLQALVRALPVPEEGGFPIVEVDGDYYVNHTSRFSTKAEADAYTGLLIYRATLDATTKGGDSE
jgi:multidrug efflux pump subunit AcrA (membrane-fusion protein)